MVPFLFYYIELSIYFIDSNMCITEYKYLVIISIVICITKQLKQNKMTLKSQFKTNEERGRKTTKIIFNQLGITEYKFSENQYDSYDVEFTYKGKKCIAEIKYLYKYSSNSFNEVYAEQKKFKLMDAHKKLLSSDKMFYIFIYNDDSSRIFNVTNWRKYTTIEKYAPKTYTDKTMIIKKFIELPNDKGVHISF